MDKKYDELLMIEERSMDKFFKKPIDTIFFETFIIDNGKDNQKYFKLSESEKKATALEFVQKMRSFVALKKESMAKDFYLIDKTQGDIEKFQYINEIKSIINALKILHKDNLMNRKSADAYNEVLKSEPVNKANLDMADKIDSGVYFETLLNNLIKNKAIFMEAYKTDDDNLIVYFYESAVLQLIISMGYLLSSCIIYSLTHERAATLKNGEVVGPKDMTYYLDYKMMAVDSTLHFHIKIIDKINKVFDDGKLYSLSSKIKNENKSIKDSNNNINIYNEIFPVLFAGVASLMSAFLFVWIIRSIIYMFYYLKGSLSNYLEAMSTFLKLHAEKVNDPKVSKKQKELAERMIKISEKIGTQHKDAIKKSLIDINNENKLSKETSAFKDATQDIF